MAARFAALLAVVLSATAAPVRASAADYGAERLDVRVGETVAVDVGFAMGMQCDDLSIVTPDIRGHDFNSNWFYVTGRSPGSTYCRAGTQRGRPSYVFYVVVSQ